MLRAEHVIRPAEAADLADVETLLRDAMLPTAGVAEHFGSFVVVEHRSAVIAAAGLEIHGSTALLRSVVVLERERGRGLGIALTTRLLADAAARGVREVYVLTTTATAFFPRLGFAPVGRHELPSALDASEELRGACPASAVALGLSLRDRTKE